MKEDYPWMKQVRPLKRLWDQRKRIEKEFEELNKTTGKHGGNIQGSLAQKVLSKRRGIKRLGDKCRKSALEQLFVGLKDWFNKQISAGNYVDREDLWAQYNYVAKKAAGECIRWQAEGIYDGAKIKLNIAIQNREADLERRFEAKKMKLMYLLMREI